MYMDGGVVRAEQNCAGGINGGITNGMPLVFEATLRPTPSIARQQFTVDLAKGENAAPFSSLSTGKSLAAQARRDSQSSRASSLTP